MAFLFRFSALVFAGQAMGYFIHSEGGNDGGIQDEKMLLATIRFFVDTFAGQEWLSDEKMLVSLADFFERHPGEGPEVWGPYFRAAKAILGVEPGVELEC
jgi:hypothetical protein